MTIAFVSGTNVATFPSGTPSSAVDTTGCDLLVVSVSYFTGGATPTVTDSKSNTWTGLTARNTGNNSTNRLYYAKNPTVGSGHTFTVTASNTTMCVSGFSGTNTTAPFDQENGAGSVNATSLATGSVTPSEDNELVVTGINTGNNGSPFTIGSGFTISVQNTGGGSNFDCGLAYIIQTTAGAVNPTWTINALDQVSTTIATFKSAAAGGGIAKSLLVPQQMGLLIGGFGG